MGSPPRPPPSPMHPADSHWHHHRRRRRDAAPPCAEVGAAPPRIWAPALPMDPGRTLATASPHTQAPTTWRRREAGETVASKVGSSVSRGRRESRETRDT
ncbi:hypothetical protein ZWY2020_037041 [Hordeum vulgare]|nr:hypothetical protein ZWY2020_037041 [Hordeum vulgare]